VSPDTFHALLDRATDGAPPAPLPWSALEAGHQRLRTRRRRLAAATSAAVAVLAVGGLAVLLPGGSSKSQPPVTDPTTDAQVLQRCLDSVPEPGASALVASGTPTLEVSVRTDLKTVATVASADRTMWGQCWVWRQPKASMERSAGMLLFASTPRPDAGLSAGWTFGTGCGLPETETGKCAVWSVSGADQLPSEVAAVRFDLGDGTSETLQTHDGFYVLNLLRPLPPGGRVNRHGAAIGFDFATQLTYLAADGTPLAAARLDSLTNGGHTEVDGLAPLTDYPSIGRPWVP
jgi:hypothetical protein